LDANRKGLNRFVSGWGEGFARTKAELGPVEGTGDDIAVHFAVGELGVVVGAQVLDGEILAVDVEHRDDRVVDLDDPPS